MYDYQSQVLIGTVLGGSSLVKPPKGVNYYLSMRSNNETWLRYKMEEMPDYFASSSIRKYGTTFRANSCCCDRLTEFRELLYEGNSRKINMVLLDQLRDTAFAIWFLDGGGKTGRERRNAYLNATKFGEEGAELMLKFFNEVEWPCNVNRDGKRIKLLFTVEGSVKFFKDIAHRFPTFMWDRI